MRDHLGDQRETGGIVRQVMEIQERQLILFECGARHGDDFTFLLVQPSDPGQFKAAVIHCDPACFIE